MNFKQCEAPGKSDHNHFGKPSFNIFAKSTFVHMEIMTYCFEIIKNMIEK